MEFKEVHSVSVTSKCINNALEPCKGSKVKEDLVYFEFVRSASAKSKEATGSEDTGHFYHLNPTYA